MATLLQICASNIVFGGHINEMDTNTKSQCCDSEGEICASNSNEASETPETISSLNEAKQDKTTTASTKPFVSVHPFKTRDEFLSAMMEDVTEWLNSLFNLDIKSAELMLHLQTGVLLCRLANVLNNLMVGDEKRDPGPAADRGPSLKSKDDRETTSSDVRRSVATRPLATISGNGALAYRENAPRGSFQSRDNISNFLNWCRNRLKLADTVLFETEDLVAGRNERNVILCLLEVARRGSKHGMPVPELIELETEIDAELGQESMAEDVGEVERLTEEGTEEESNEAEIEQATSNSNLGVLREVERSLEEDKGAMMAAFMGGRSDLQGLTIPSPHSGLCLRLRDLLRMRDRRPEIHRLKETIQMDMLTLDDLVCLCTLAAAVTAWVLFA